MTRSGTARLAIVTGCHPSRDKRLSVCSTSGGAPEMTLYFDLSSEVDQAEHSDGDRCPPAASHLHYILSARLLTCPQPEPKMTRQPCAAWGADSRRRAGVSPMSATGRYTRPVCGREPWSSRRAMSSRFRRVNICRARPHGRSTERLRLLPLKRRSDLLFHRIRAHLRPFRSVGRHDFPVPASTTASRPLLQPMKMRLCAGSISMLLG